MLIRSDDFGFRSLGYSENDNFLFKLTRISAYGGYGAAPIQQVPRMMSAFRDQTIQRPFVPTRPVATQSYGQQKQLDMSLMQPKIQNNYG